MFELLKGTQGTNFHLSEQVEPNVVDGTDSPPDVTLYAKMLLWLW